MLVWSSYDNDEKEPLNSSFISCFVPKQAILDYEGRGWSFYLSTTISEAIKYLYLYNDHIYSGDIGINNALNWSYGGRTLDNRTKVLRAVYGV